MKLTKDNSILIIAPSLIAESLSLKLTSLDNNLNISLEINDKKLNPDVIVWNILNFQEEDLLRLELLKLKQRYEDSKVLLIFSGDLKNNQNSIPSLNCEGLLYNPSVEKVLDSIYTIFEGGKYLGLV